MQALYRVTKSFDMKLVFLSICMVCLSLLSACNSRTKPATGEKEIAADSLAQHHDSVGLDHTKVDSLHSKDEIPAKK